VTQKLAIAPLLLLLLVVPLVALGGCQQIGLAAAEVDETAVRESGGPKQAVHIVVQHVLIAHEGGDQPGVMRSIEQARVLAETVLEKDEAGADFAGLVNLYGDDLGTDGIYAIANFGAETTDSSEVERVGLVRGFGDLAFSLEPNEIGFVVYDPVRSPHGFHVIKRLR